MLLFGWIQPVEYENKLSQVLPRQNSRSLETILKLFEMDLNVYWKVFHHAIYRAKTEKNFHDTSVSLNANRSGTTI